MLSEEIDELQEFLGISCQTSQLREDESGYVPRTNVFEHSFGFRCVLYRLPGDGVETIDLDHLPALGFGVQASTPFVMFGAFSFYLVFGRDPNPDADAFGRAVAMNIYLSPKAFQTNNGQLNPPPKQAACSQRPNW